jgi:hypothetical protein
MEAIKCKDMMEYTQVRWATGQDSQTKSSAAWAFRANTESINTTFWYDLRI